MKQSNDLTKTKGMGHDSGSAVRRIQGMVHSGNHGQRYAGQVTEQTIGGASLLRVDIPNTSRQPGFTKFFSSSSIYAITPTTEELAVALAESLGNAPIYAYDLPQYMRDRLRDPVAVPAITAKDFDDDFDDEDDEDDDEPL